MGGGRGCPQLWYLPCPTTVLHGHFLLKGAEPGEQPSPRLSTPMSPHSSRPAVEGSPLVLGDPHIGGVTPITPPTVLLQSPQHLSTTPSRVLLAGPPPMAIQRCQAHLCPSGTSGLSEDRPCTLLVWTHGYLELPPCQGLRSPTPKGLSQARNFPST